MEETNLKEDNPSSTSKENENLKDSQILDSYESSEIETSRFVFVQSPYFSSWVSKSNLDGAQEPKHAPDFSPRVLDNSIIADSKNFSEFLASSKTCAVFADLHIHSRFSRACSKDLNLVNLVKWARIKGLGLLGTGDFTHNEWLSELKNNLKEENGIFWYNPISLSKDNENSKIAAEAENKGFPFILSSEISLIYTQNGKGRSVHLVYLAPDFEAVDKINSWLDTKGRRDYDGRPIFKISCRDFAAKMQEIDDRIEVICAHSFTPYFGIFGSESGFDSLKEAFEDKLDRIHAIETGISADPEMCWKIKDLNNISILSFSDAHSFWPWRLGREASIFSLENGKELSYDSIINQIRENNFIGTIETDPAYGKYHFDGHINCNFSSSPEETRKLNGICPVCGKPLIIGVDNRVEKLASSDSNPKIKHFYYKVLPLHEIISLAIGIGVNSKATWKIYNELIDNFETEFNILLNVSKIELAKVIKSELLVDLIIRNREGKIKVKAGYDGKYGEPVLSEKQARLF